jgi:hypothetical protein
MLKWPDGMNECEQEQIERARQASMHCLQDVPFLCAESATMRLQVDGKHHGGIVTRVRTPARERLLLAEVRSSGQPRIARGAIDQLFHSTTAIPEAYGVFMAPYVPPRAAEVCTDAGVGYAGLAGNCRLVFDEVYIRIEGNANPKGQKRELRSLYSPKAERVIRVLLTHPGRCWKLQELARDAHVSIGQTHNVKGLLDAREWLRIPPEGFFLSDPRPCWRSGPRTAVTAAATRGGFAV